MKMKSKMPIQNSLQYQIVDKVKQELDINEYSVLDILPLFFKNHRIRGNKVIGVRLTVRINTYAKEFYRYNLN